MHPPAFCFFTERFEAYRQSYCQKFGSALMPDSHSARVKPDHAAHWRLTGFHDVRRWIAATGLQTASDHAALASPAVAGIAPARQPANPTRSSGLRRLGKGHPGNAPDLAQFPRAGYLSAPVRRWGAGPVLTLSGQV